MLRFSSTNRTTSFSSGLLSTQSIFFSACIYAWDCSNPHAGPCTCLVELHDILMGPPLKPISLSLGGTLSIWVASLPSGGQPFLTPYQQHDTILVSLANFLRVHSIPLSASPTKILNSTGSNTNLCGPLVIPDLLLDNKPLTASLQMQTSRQFFIH